MNSKSSVLDFQKYYFLCPLNLSETPSYKAYNRDITKSRVISFLKEDNQRDINAGIGSDK